MESISLTDIVAIILIKRPFTFSNWLPHLVVSSGAGRAGVGCCVEIGSLGTDWKRTVTGVD